VELANTSRKIGFLTEWQIYAQKLEGDSWLGERMDAGKVDKMSGIAHLILLDDHDWSFEDQQLAQMYELMQAIRKKQLEDNESE